MYKGLGHALVQDAGLSYWKVDDVVNLEVDKIEGVWVRLENEDGSGEEEEEEKGKKSMAVNNIYLDWIRWSAGATSSDRDKNADKISLSDDEDA